MGRINRDRCEIRWKDNKISHFDLIKHIKDETAYKEIVENKIKRVVEAFDDEKIKKIIENVDKELPEKYFRYKLTDNRKRLIGKFVSLRVERLKQILK